ncbi:MAG: hypothetical protein FWD74_08700, partial [Actinomycetia bacterium]|nr:hypothetical protein [Actinomycetes bacterium]
MGLGADGSIASVDRSDIAQQQSGFHASVTALDPKSVAAQLPVRITVLYQAGSRVGSDLAEAAGASGPVKVSVTVTNTSGKPESVTVDGAATTAMVTTPYTVLATAVLPKNAVSDVTAVAQAERGNGSFTGTVSTLPDGDYQVQWAAILAPPALGSAATFDLAVTATKFALGSFTIQVTPGVSADPAMTTLIDTQFGAASPLAITDNNTIGQIAQIQQELAGVQSNLVMVQADLATQAKTGGQQVVGVLTDSER